MAHFHEKDLRSAKKAITQFHGKKLKPIYVQNRKESPRTQETFKKPQNMELCKNLREEGRT